MPKYQYRAADAGGKAVKGILTAADENELYEKLKTEGKYLISAKKKAERRRTVQLKPKALADFCRELGTLLGAGVTLVRALGMVAQNESVKPRERAVYAELLRRIRQGVALSDAMESMDGVFPPMLVSMFRASEAAGNMDVTARRMGEHYNKEYRLNAKVKSSMTYPKLLGGLIILVVAVLVGYVLPQFDSLFSLMEELPLPTQILYAITDFVGQYWYLVIAGAVAAVAVIRTVCKIAAVRLLLDRARVHLPLVGKLWKVIYTARFARSLSSLYTAGIPIVTAMQIAKNSIGNAYIEKQFDQAVPVVRAGGNLSDAIGPMDGFVGKLAFSTRVGEETGSLDTMLASVAADLEYESELAVNKMVSYLEPGMIIVMAVIVGFVMVAVMMPIYASYSAIETSAYN